MRSVWTDEEQHQFDQLVEMIRQIDLPIMCDVPVGVDDMPDNAWSMSSTLPNGLQIALVKGYPFGRALVFNRPNNNY